MCQNQLADPAVAACIAFDMVGKLRQPMRTRCSVLFEQPRRAQGLADTAEGAQRCTRNDGSVGPPRPCRPCRMIGWEPMTGAALIETKGAPL
jgi:hypothetical protein